MVQSPQNETEGWRLWQNQLRSYSQKYRSDNSFKASVEYEYVLLL